MVVKIDISIDLQTSGFIAAVVVFKFKTTFING